MLAPPIDLAVRPEAIELRPTGATPLAATIAKAAYLGSAMEYTVDTEVGAQFVVDRNVERPLVPGAAVSIAFVTYGVVAIPR